MFLVDSNVLIEAKNRYYGFDIAPGFWAWLDLAHDQQIACSIDRVREELLAGNDELADWSRLRRVFFRPVDEPTTAQFAQLTVWAKSRNYTTAAINQFVGNTADFYLIAYARAHGHTVVTHEQPAPKARARVLIPDACLAMAVPYVDTFAMLRSARAALDLRPA